MRITPRHSPARSNATPRTRIATRHSPACSTATPRLRIATRNAAQILPNRRTSPSRHVFNTHVTGTNTAAPTAT